MLTLAALLGSLLAAVCLALAMPRHHRQCTGGEPSSSRARSLRIMALGVSLLSTWMAVRAWGAGMGCIAAFGIFTLTAGVVAFGLPAIENLRRSKAGGLRRLGERADPRHT